MIFKLQLHATIWYSYSNLFARGNYHLQGFLPLSANLYLVLESYLVV